MSTGALAPRQRLREREAAAFLGPVSVRTLQDWRARRVGPVYTKVGRRVAYDVADLEAFLRANRVAPKHGIAELA